MLPALEYRESYKADSFGPGEAWRVVFEAPDQGQVLLPEPELVGGAVTRLVEKAPSLAEQRGKARRALLFYVSKAIGLAKGELFDLRFLQIVQ